MSPKQPTTKKTTYEKRINNLGEDGVQLHGGDARPLRCHMWGNIDYILHGDPGVLPASAM